MTPHPPPQPALSAAVTPAGVDWDAIRVAQAVGLGALRTLQTTVGAVLVDPLERALYFMVAPGTTWNLPGTRLLGAGHHLILVPPDRDKPPGPYWLHPPGETPHTEAADLRRALKAVLATCPTTGHRRPA